jgi:predicted CoA-binding protein
MKVAVVGASEKEERYSNKAMKLLMEFNHEVLPVAPKGDSILDLKVHRSLTDISHDIDTVTMYVGPKNQDKIIQDILSIKPKRVIFNPGTENIEAYEQLKTNGIEVVEDCTLIMLNQDRF